MDSTKNAGVTMISYLINKGRKDPKAGVATTEELAEVIGKSVKFTFDRLHWLAKREGKLIKMGCGKEAVWRVSAKHRKVLEAA